MLSSVPTLRYLLYTPFWDTIRSACGSNGSISRLLRTHTAFFTMRISLPLSPSTSPALYHPPPLPSLFSLLVSLSFSLSFLPLGLFLLLFDFSLCFVRLPLLFELVRFFFSLYQLPSPTLSLFWNIFSFGPIVSSILQYRGRFGGFYLDRILGVHQVIARLDVMKLLYVSCVCIESVS